MSYKILTYAFLLFLSHYLDIHLKTHLVPKGLDPTRKKKANVDTHFGEAEALAKKVFFIVLVMPPVDVLLFSLSCAD